jgi:hypothetical protein
LGVCGARVCVCILWVEDESGSGFVLCVCRVPFGGRRGRCGGEGGDAVVRAGRGRRARNRKKQKRVFARQGYPEEDTFCGVRTTGGKIRAQNNKDTVTKKRAQNNKDTVTKKQSQKTRWVERK